MNLPFKLKTRPILLQWHRWFGLLASLWLFLLAATGTFIVFYEPVDNALNADLKIVEPQTTHTPLAQWVKAAEQHPNAKSVVSIDIPDAANESVRTVVEFKPTANSEKPEYKSVYVNPYNNDVLGERDIGSVGFGKRDIVNLIYELHIDLLLGPKMLWFFGLVSFLWLIDHIISLVLAFPSKRKWPASFKVRWKAGGYKRLFDSHRSIGVWFAPVTFVVALSGLYFTWYDEVTHVVEAFSPITPRYIFTVDNPPPYEGAPTIAINEALARVNEYTQGAEVDMLRLNSRKGVYDVRVFDERDIDPYGRRYIVVNAYNGEIMSDQHGTEGGTGNTYIAWQYPLHSGKAFGWPGRLLVAASGLVTMWFIISGLMIFFRKMRTAKAKR